MENKRQLIQDLIKGDIFAFDEVFRKYNKKIYAISYSYLKNKEDAEGVVQTVFLNLWKKRADLKEQYNIDSYLFTITYNTIRKSFRKLTRERTFQEEYRKFFSINDDSTSMEIEYKNLLELADMTIDRLPERQKTVYHLNMREGLTCEEIAKKLGISRRTAENHLHRAKACLKKALADNRFLSILFVWMFIQ